MEIRSIGFIGGGRITRIMLHAFANKQVKFGSITVCDTNQDVLIKLKNEFSYIEICENPVEPAQNDLVVIALHPPAIVETMEKIKENVDKNAVILSLAPKITMNKISAILKNNNVIRMIPNATSFINKGYNPICFSSGFQNTLKIEILQLLRTLGYTFETGEQKLEGFAIISAMLPTYFWFQWLEMEAIGETIGLDSRETREAIRETLLAATQLFYNPDLTHEEVMDLIPVKPVAEHEQAIRECFRGKLLPLFDKIKSEPATA